MESEQLKKIIPGLTKEQETKLLEKFNVELDAEKQKTTAMTEERDRLQTQLTEATKSLKAFDGVDVNDLNAQIKALQQKLETQATDFAFDGKLSQVLRKYGAKNEKAARALLDVEALKASKNQDADLEAAMKALQSSDGYLFTTGETGMRTENSGAPHGKAGTGEEEDGVIAAFRKLNPTLNL